MKNIRKSVILIPGGIFAVVLILGMVNTEKFLNILNTGFSALMGSCGWILSITALIYVIFALVVLFHPIGKIRIGGSNAKPRLDYWKWFAVSLCAGIGTGIVFWGAVEPILFTMEPSPSLGLTPGSNEAVMWAMRTSFLHWTFTPYAIYVVFGVILAYVIYNMKMGDKVSSGFVPLIGKKATSASFSAIIDVLTVFAICGGMAGSLGFGILQLGIGTDLVFGIKPTTLVHIAICAIIVVVYIATSVSGLQKGVTWLGNKNATAYMILLIFMLCAGPTRYILNLLVQSSGSYFSHFLEGMTYTAPFVDGANWPQSWDMFWWADWMTYGPIMGLFYAKLGYGRTIRQFVIVNWVLPAVFGIVWFTIFGGVGLHAQLFEGIDLYSIYLEKGAEAMTFATFDLLPFAKIVKPIMLVIIAVSFITLANSMVCTIAKITIKDNREGEAPMSLKIFWGVMIGAVSLLFTLTGGIDGIKMVKTFAGFPISFVGLLMLAGFLLHMSRRPRNEKGEYLYEDIIADAPDSDEPPMEVSPMALRLQRLMSKLGN